MCGILGALHHRDKTGEGQFVDSALVDAGVALSVWEATQYFSRGEIPEALGSAHRMSAPYQAIRCADGYITLGAANDRLFERLADLLEHPEWKRDERFVTDSQRVQNREVLAAEIEEVTLEKTRSYWLEQLVGQDIPCGPINNYGEVMNEPQVRAREMVVETTHPTMGSMSTLGSPIKLSETPLTPGRPAPMLGQHTDVILAECGYKSDEIDRLRKDGVVR